MVEKTSNIPLQVKVGKPLLQACGVSKSFFKNKTQIAVLRDVDLAIAAGEAVAVTGASGVGKSTLLHILGGLEPPTRGKVLFGNELTDLATLTDQALSAFRNQSLGFVFQFHYLLQDFTALENVMFPALIAGYSKKIALQRAAELLKTVGLVDRFHHPPHQLSGGEQQRVAVARALVLHPPCLLADELTGNLDSFNRNRVIDLLLELNQSLGIAILLVTHDLEVAKKMNRVLFMSDGRITE